MRRLVKMYGGCLVACIQAASAQRDLLLMVVHAQQAVEPFLAVSPRQGLVGMAVHAGCQNARRLLAGQQGG